MAEAWAWALGSVALVSIISLVGAAALLFRRIATHTVLLVLVALAAGTLMGDTFLHLLPEAVAETGFTTRMAGYILLGFVVMFLLELVLRRQHAHAELIDDHDHGDHIAPFGWLNLVGDGLHNLIDGLIIAASYLVDIHLGIATTIAVVAHEVPQELGDFAVLLRAGFRPTRALLLNLASALVSFLGALGVLLFAADAEALSHVAVPLIAGAFLYIAAADLIPELHHHVGGKYAPWIVVGFLAGIGLMFGLLELEPLLPGEHAHQ